MEDDILAGIPSDSDSDEAIDSMFDEKKDEQVKETPAESPTGTETKTEESPSHQGEPEDSTDDESKLPFHKHPRWKEMYETNKTLKEQNELMLEKLSRLDDVSERVTELAKSRDTQPTAVPEWFARLYGNDPEVYRLYNEASTQEKASMREEIKREVAKELQQEEQQRQQSLKQGIDWVQKNIQSLKDSGEQFDENELKKVALDYKPTDDEGNIDFTKALSILKATKSSVNAEKSKARKEIGAAVTSTPKSVDAKKPDFKTASEFKGRDPFDWRTAENN